MKRSAILLCLTAAQAACASGDAEQRVSVEVRDSAGVRIVTTGTVPRDTLRLTTPAVRIGSADLDVAAAYEFQLLSDLAVLPAGAIVAVDNRGARIAVYDDQGEWRADLGRRGRGPGEYTGPIGASVNGDTIFVWDALLRRLSSYTAAGGFQHSIEIAQRTAGLPIRVVADGYLDEVEWGQHMDPAPAMAALVRRDRSGALLDTVVAAYPVPDIGWQWADEAQTRGMMVNPPIFSVRPTWTVHEDRLVRVAPGTADVHVLDLASGRLRSVYRLNRPVAPPTAADEAAYVDAFITRLGLEEERRSALRESATFADIRPAISKVVVDDEGRIWVAEHDPRAWMRRYVGAGWDVLDPDGSLVRHVRFPDSFELMVVRDGRAYGVATAENDLHIIDVFIVNE